MSKITTEKHLVKALLKDGGMSMSLYEEELRKGVEDFLKSKQEDGDDYFFVITEESGHVAMLLIDSEDKVHANEEARAMLKKFWPKSAYEEHIQDLLPQMVDELINGYYFVTGVRRQEEQD
jgi:hypothetical protein